jgi:hypothetical protein
MTWLVVMTWLVMMTWQRRWMSRGSKKKKKKKKKPLETRICVSRGCKKMVGGLKTRGERAVRLWWGQNAWLGSGRDSKHAAGARNVWLGGRNG